ncbi:uncharacterized protein [Littorina saxatilis]|uniref:Uncharacterized protein n=1 Tax=Littorina saxatilis TaxID=31220 RepID=A0AAN9G0J6_9CAEN
MDQPSTCPYPGFDKSGDYYTPRRAPRVRPEAEEFASKNAGSINLFSDEKNKHIVTGPPPSPRCLTNEAKQNYQKGRKGQVSGLLGGGGPMPAVDKAPAPRVKPEAQDIAEHHKGSGMMGLIANDSRRPQSARSAPRVKVEASENAELGRGDRMNCLMHDAKKLPDTPKPMPRVRPEAEGTAGLGQGSQMAKVMFKYGTTPRSTRGVPRVKQEASENATLDQGGRMQNLFTNYGHQPQSARPAPKVRDGWNNAELDQGGRLSRLMHEGDKMRGDAKPQIRASSASGRLLTKKGKGSSISQIFSQNSKWQMVATVGVRQGKAY